MEWEQRVADLWASFDDQNEDEFLARMDALVAELPADSGRGVPVSLALAALSRHLPRYQRSLATTPG